MLPESIQTKPEKKSRDIVCFWLRLIAFALLVFAVLAYASFVLTPKYDYGICSIVNLYQQKENSIDVLVLGTSLAYAGVNTNILWQEYGLATYNLCNAEQPFWISYYYLEEALKTQMPRLILLDAKASIYEKDYLKPARTILCTYGIRAPVTRLKAIAASVEKQEVLGFYLAFPKLHNNYSEMNWDAFQLFPDNGGRGPTWKGFIEVDQFEKHERPSLVWTDIKRPLNAKQQEYFEKILQLTQQKGIPVLLVGFPNPDYANDHMFYNSLWSVAAQYGVSGINYNNPNLRFGLRYSSDFADWQHLNIKGSVTFSRRLGEDIRTCFDVPDRRGDPEYASYDLCAADWYAKYTPFVSLPPQ